MAAPATAAAAAAKARSTPGRPPRPPTSRVFLLSVDLQPSGLIEKLARGARHFKRAARGDLHRFKAIPRTSSRASRIRRTNPTTRGRTTPRRMMTPRPRATRKSSTALARAAGASLPTDTAPTARAVRARRAAHVPAGARHLRGRPAEVDLAAVVHGRRATEAEPAVRAAQAAAGAAEAAAEAQAAPAKAQAAPAKAQAAHPQTGDRGRAAAITEGGTRCQQT